MGIELYGNQLGDKMLRGIYSSLGRVITLEKEMREAASKLKESFNYNATNDWLTISLAHSDITPSFKYLSNLPKEIITSELVSLKETMEKYSEVLNKEVPRILTKSVTVVGEELEAMRCLLESMIKNLNEKYTVVSDRLYKVGNEQIAAINASMRIMMEETIPEIIS